MAFAVYAQTPSDVKYKFTEASDLNIIGKVLKETPNPYHRVDTCKYKGFTKSENIQVRCASGLAVLFRTNSTTISVLGDYGYINNGVNTMGIALRGYDLYIKKDGEWLYAASGVPNNPKEGKNHVLIKNMDNSEKECMLYLPIYSEMYSVKIGVEEGSEIEALESPFKYRVTMFGSSFTQGISISRSGMSYPAQFTRHTGIQLLSLGCSGNSKLQPYFADVLNDAEADAMLFDAFSNPKAEMIHDRLFPFIEKIREVHPETPLIFMQTIYRERRNFDLNTDKVESEKMHMADSLMKIATKKYKNVYFIQTDTGENARETSADGTHPTDMGYLGWSKSIEKQVVKILRKHGLK